MATTCLTPLPAAPSREQLLQQLTEIFGEEISLWTRGGADWQGLHGIDPPERAQRPLRQWLADHAATLETSQIVTLQEQPHLLVPLQLAEARWVMVRAVGRDSAAAWLKLAEGYRRLCERERVLDAMQAESESFALQVTRDFEELTFLRHMADCLKMSADAVDFRGMAEKVLPMLLPVVEAEMLVLVLQGSQQGERPQRDAVLLSSGEPVLNDDGILTLIDHHYQQAEMQPVVRNGCRQDDLLRRWPEVRQLVLVRIATGPQCLGWLLAINQQKQLAGASEFASPDSTGFGSGEATLLESAASVLATYAHNVELLQAKERLLVNVVRALVAAIEAKDDYTCGHSERVARFARRLAEEMQMEEGFCENLYLSGLLHDIGKIGVPDATLKKPGPLTDQEFEAIKLHPDAGWAILQDLNALQYVLPGVVHHHERYDGKGYPDGLAGEAIPIEGRILAVADAYDAMTSDRPYRPGMSQAKAESILKAGAGREWDPQVIEHFFRAMPDILRIRNLYQREPAPVRRRNAVCGTPPCAQNDG